MGDMTIYVGLLSVIIALVVLIIYKIWKGDI